MLRRWMAAPGGTDMRMRMASPSLPPKRPFAAVGGCARSASAKTASWFLLSLQVAPKDSEEPPAGVILYGRFSKDVLCSPSMDHTFRRYGGYVQRPSRSWVGNLSESASH